MPRLQGTAQRNRLDHILPRSYLRGFTNPSRQGQLSVYDLERKKWFETKPDKVAASRGFYDYSLESAPDQTADESFKKLEERFPHVRKELVERKFLGWRPHLDILLTYAQMLRARTRLFREQQLTSVRQATLVRATEVVTDPTTGKTAIKYEELTETPEEREELYRNMTITTMRGEIAKGPGFFSDLDWCLRLAPETTNPVITGDNPVIVVGQVPTIEVALDDTQTQIFFPVCRHACLIGNRTRFEVETADFDPAELRTLHSRYLSAGRFAYSPVRLAV